MDEKKTDTWWQVNSDEARRDFRHLLDSVEHEKAHVTVSRYNTPSAVMVPVGWYRRAAAALGEIQHALSEGQS